MSMTDAQINSRTADSIEFETTYLPPDLNRGYLSSLFQDTKNFSLAVLDSYKKEKEQRGKKNTQ